MTAEVIEEKVYTGPYGGPPKYALGWRTTDVANNFTVDTSSPWNAYESNDTSFFKSDSTGTNEFTTITLSEGKNYKLEGKPCLADSAETTVFKRRFQWYNETKQQYVGSEGGIYSAGDNYAGGATGPAVAYVSTSEDETFSLRCTYVFSDVDLVTMGTYFNAQLLS
jgi:hypothetical protein